MKTEILHGIYLYTVFHDKTILHLCLELTLRYSLCVEKSTSGTRGLFAIIADDLYLFGLGSDYSTSTN